MLHRSALIVGVRLSSFRNAQMTSHLLEAVVDLLLLIQVAESPNTPFVTPVERLDDMKQSGIPAVVTKRYS